MTRPNNREDREQAIKRAIMLLKEEDYTYNEILGQLDEVYKKEAKSEELSVPLSVFDNTELSALEAVVKYLKENIGLRLTDIATLINRDQRAVGVTYKFASTKLRDKMAVSQAKYSLPLNLLKDRRLSPLECVVSYLRTTHALSYHQIALILKRDDRTIWTVTKRFEKKIAIKYPKK